MPKVVSKGNDKYGGHCDGGFSQLSCCCVYYSEIRTVNKLVNYFHVRPRIKCIRNLQVEQKIVHESEIMWEAGKEESEVEMNRMCRKGGNLITWPL